MLYMGRADTRQWRLSLLDPKRDVWVEIETGDFWKVQNSRKQLREALTEELIAADRN
jgi:hypothetical protein